jgi:hypothetical protein
MFTRFVTIACLGCGVLFSPVGASAQASGHDQTYFTYVAQWAVPRSGWAAFEKGEKEDDATMQKLLADGTIIAWGDEAARVHTVDGFTHADWFTATSRANLLKALEQLMGNSTAPAFQAVTKHADLFLHTLAHNGKTSSNGTGYLRVAFWRVRPGEGDALEGHFKSALKPTLDRDVENGTLLMYNFDTEDIHTEEPGGYNLAMLFPDGAAIDKFYDELNAAGKDNPAVGEILDSLMVAKEHRDTFGRVTAYAHK